MITAEFSPILEVKRRPNITRKMKKLQNNRKVILFKLTPS